MNTEASNLDNSQNDQGIVDPNALQSSQTSHNEIDSTPAHNWFQTRHPFVVAPKHPIGEPAAFEGGRHLADTTLFSIYQKDEHVFIPTDVKAVFIDVDGTAMRLKDTEGQRQEAFRIAIGKIARLHGHELSADEIHRIHRIGEGKVEFEMSREYARELSSMFGSTVCYHHVYQEWIVASKELRSSSAHPATFINEGMANVCAEARARGVHVRFCTNGADEFVKPLLEQAGFAEWADLESSMYINRHQPQVRFKPEADGYLELCKQHGLKPSEVIVFEDSVTGAMAGIRAGARVIFQPSEDRFNAVSALTRTVREQHPEFFHNRKGSVALLAENCEFGQVRFLELQ